jgi:RNA polymerase sigma-70 factor (ECF subfamily)
VPTSGQAADGFEQHRGRLRSIAYRMLGSLSEAEDAVQETWVRLDRTDTTDVANLGGWLTTVVGRICLNMLRAQQSRPDQPAGLHVPDPVVTRPDGTGPEDQALMAESVGMAMLVVLETLTPSERLAFVLHDMFSVPFGEIAEVLGQSPQAARQLASRARRKVTLAGAEPDPDLGRQRRAVDAFFAASRDGDFAALLAVLDPDVVLRSDGGPSRPAAAGLVRGADPGRGAGDRLRPVRRRDQARSRQRRRRGRRRPAGPPGVGHGVHGAGRQDPRHRRSRRPAAAAGARPDVVVGMTLPS